MSRNKTAGLPRPDQARVTAAEWFAGGQRIWYDPGGHLTTSEHPDLLAAAIRDVAARHGVSTTATASR
jgi:pimeloyl-ACP methyl ester carboxylesterase